MQASDLWTSTRGGSTSCTWVHPRVAQGFARWLNPSFVFWLETWTLSPSPSCSQAGATPRLWGHQVRILSETDLHAQVVSWLRRNHPSAILVPSLGELQDTETRRLDAYAKGHKGGQPDLLVIHPHNRYSGMALEFKTPRHEECPEPSDAQRLFLERLQRLGFKTIVSNDLLEIYFELRMYFSDIRV
jgi:hypothetical protein